MTRLPEQEVRPSVRSEVLVVTTVVPYVRPALESGRLVLRNHSGTPVKLTRNNLKLAVPHLDPRKLPRNKAELTQFLEELLK